MRVFFSILALLGVLTTSMASTHLTLCDFAAGLDECCCAPKVEATAKSEQGCCAEPESAEPAPVDTCDCSIAPANEDLPSTLVVPTPGETDRLAAPTSELLAASVVMPLHVETTPHGPLNQTAPPGQNLHVFDLICSYRL